MNELLYQKIMEEFPAAYAYCKIHLGEDGKTKDCEILEMNTAFAKLCNKSKAEITGKSITDMESDLFSGESDWISCLGEAALHNGKIQQKQYSKSQKSWYKITASSPKKYYLIIYVIDITMEINQLKEMEYLIEISEKLLMSNNSKEDYQKISEDFLKIFGAKFAAFHLFEEDSMHFYTKTITGDRWIIKKAEDILGFKFEDKKWTYNVELEEKTGQKIINRFSGIRELAGYSISPSIAELIEKTFQIGEVVVVKIEVHHVILGYLILFMSKDHYFDKDILAKVYSRQLAMFIIRSRAEAALREEKLLLNSIFESIPGMIYLYDEENRLVRWNKKHEEFTGYSAEELAGMTLYDWYKGDAKSQKSVKEGLEKAMKQGFGEAEADLQKKDGTVVPMCFTASVFSLGNKRYFTGIAMDMTERKKRETEISDLSYRDQLTGLYNRRFYIEELMRLDKEANLPISIVMGDVNGLKLVNDSFGHTMGDMLLKKVAEVIKKGVRSQDIVARLSGDEFVIILPDTDKEEADKVIKRITGLAGGEKVESVELSISFGCDTKNTAGQNMEDIFKSAEDDMYKKKLFDGPKMREKTIKVIIETLYEKNLREKMHSLRVSALSVSIGKALGMVGEELELLKTAGLFHDIGKIAIDESILNKPGKLTKEEHDEIKRHSEIGFRMLNTVEDMADVAGIILYHHERWDGKGYPKGIKSRHIPLPSRIIAIANDYDEMTSDKIYGKAIAKDEAAEKIRKYSGIKYDPELVDVFLNKVYQYM